MDEPGAAFNPIDKEGAFLKAIPGHQASVTESLWWEGRRDHRL